MPRNPDYTEVLLEGRQQAIDNNRRNPGQAMLRAAAGGGGLGLSLGATVGLIAGLAIGGIKKAAVVTPRAAAAVATLMGSFSAFDCNRARIKREAAAEAAA
ncbi:hypothetical protein T484DRAFT_1740612 [Baffinella frigidus]|nr:hypothetical protein T484DRAFT_1740612 [Cryptophyta sp. CCMP2293]|mmetsp:Transcript_40588/g.96125  ORF Transcript_40588/g.96125 Transcript_40588/m.96125 type:complete len:101 (+) Transcript_40588:101-403(+)